ncbi:inactive tyrosine-protein kinase 7 isoform X3 [Conger conger]|uniref:inactive tyrosine-protein kinase 7 isoform X3 n=1 Tax=Conger conger TaxID=82655 RepID=UPI002A59FA78|nr:inactive tyrosine-protein kinase 7 isoform X3 [Conger conger]
MERKQHCWQVAVLVSVVGLWTLARVRGAQACSCAGESVPHTPVLSGPDRAYLGKRVLFRCEVPGSPRPGEYQLLRGSGDRPVTLHTLQGDPPANFTLLVRSDSSGIYRCRARTGGELSAYSLSSNSLAFQVVIPVRGASLRSDPDPPVVWEGGRLTLHCEVGAGSHLSYRWYFNRTERPAPPPGRSLLLQPVSPQHSGQYYCIVGNAMRDSRVSSSLELEVRVKGEHPQCPSQSWKRWQHGPGCREVAGYRETDRDCIRCTCSSYLQLRAFLSEPQVSFSVTKEEWGYRANVRCWATRGSPPVRFWLVKDSSVLANRTTASLSTVFSVPVSIGRSLGRLRCGAGNHGNQELLSPPLNLEVVPVGGAVQLQVEYLYSADSEAVGVTLRCGVSHGTFPEYAWFRNDTHLPGGGDSYIITPQGHTLILPIITAGNSGHYHCQAKDSFDNTSWIMSPATLVQKTDGRLVSSEVIAVMFCCFLLLVLVGSVCWTFTLSKRRVDSWVRRRSSSAPAPAAVPSSA